MNEFSLSKFLCTLTVLPQFIYYVDTYGSKPHHSDMVLIDVERMNMHFKRLTPNHRVALENLICELMRKGYLESNECQVEEEYFYPTHYKVNLEGIIQELRDALEA